MKILVAFVAFSVAMVLANDLEEFATSNKQFSANIYKELAAENTGNFVVSPMSTEIVLSMVHAGAKKQTAQELATGLSLPDSTPKIKSMMEVVFPKLKSIPNQYTLKTANKMYAGHNLKINNDFKTTVTDVFKSTVETIDFKQKDEAVTKINDWVADNTEKKIENLIQPSDITDNTRAILLNALYFEGSWVNSFYDEQTKKARFHTSKAGSVEVDMMEVADTFEYRKCGYFKAKFLKMPYIGGDLSMVVILPDEKDGLAHIEANIHEALEPQNFTYKNVHVNFPKFKMDTTIKFVPILKKLGMVGLFDEGADLSGITSDGIPLFISNVIQKNYVDVNEKGTVAASATAAVVSDSLSLIPDPAVEFIADHPFIYYIVSPAGILFVGRFSGH